MNVEWFPGRAALSERAFGLVADMLKTKARTVMALPTGETPLRLYERLIRAEHSKEIQLSEARFFNLDEFVGKGPADPGSYAYFLHRNFFAPAGIDPARIRLLRGDCVDWRAECEAYEAAILAAGGIDLAILGLGRNGHIAFNEPGSDWASRTRRVTLAEKTREAQALLYPNPEDVPREGLTMGIGTILEARHILLLASGSGKKRAMAALLNGKPDPAWPVTALLSHPRVSVLATQDLGPVD
ncbi:glucosamine-6-phosphate deaminase [Acidocella sp.]|uniref:glucosamine-6-phosphate deaminase n=1 Tax=Acidocella sp. TaxID=50710 RepID=UPI002616A472|nr:glucosamine-6-phosphate deaminase [Acidocella sp.]